MPIDPQVKVVLDGMAAAGLSDGLSVMKDMPVPAVRQMMDQMRVPTPLDPVASVEDRKIPGPGGDIPVRIYRPEGGSGVLPVLMYFHGGGWVIGDLESHDVSCRTLCKNSGAVVIATDYRLAPESKYPAAADDCYAAVQWVAANAGALGVDARRIAVGGDSAGGNLAAVVCQMARDTGGPRICFQMLIYPVTDHSYGTRSYHDNANGYLLTELSMRWFWGHYLNNEIEGMEPYASPMRAKSLAGLPPALVQTAEFDPLRDEGEAYAAALKAAGVPVQCTRYDGLIHGYFGMHNAIDAAMRAHGEAAAALKAAFGAVPA